MCSEREITIEKKEQINKELIDEISNLKHKVSKAKGCYISATKALEMNVILTNISDDKTQLEETYISMKGMFEKMKEQNEANIARAENADRMLKMFDNETK